MLFSRPLWFNCSDSSTMRLWTGVGTGTREDEEGEGGKLREGMERESCAPDSAADAISNQMSLNKASSLVQAAQKVT